MGKFYSVPSLKRLPGYLAELKRMRASGIVSASCPTLGRALELDSMTVRKDIEIIGISGQTGVGFAVRDLIDGIERFLGWKNTSEAFLFGASEIGKALLAERHFSEYGLRIIAGFDRAVTRRDELAVHDVPFFPVSELPHLADRLKIRMAVLTVPDAEAAEAAAMLAEAGIMAIWDFTHANLKLAPDIIVQKVNLAGDLAILSVKLREKLDSENQPE